MKPKYLYHGSQYKFDIIKPHKACGEKPNESLMAIYAYESPDEVIPFALPIRWYPDTPEGKRSFRTLSGKTFLDYGSINPNGKGYIYKMDSTYFNRIENGQWISDVAVIPVETNEILVNTYWDTITFSPEAQKIQSELYGSNA